jgi:protein involved in polysaccharide export with SLBB domain
MEDIRPGMSAEEIARVLKAIREAGGAYAESDNVPTVTTEEDRKIQAIMTRDFRLEPMTVDEQKSLAAAAGAALKAAKQ